MPLFRYRALTEEGKKKSGVIEAESYIQAKERLRHQRVMVVELTPLEKDKEKEVFDASLLLTFTRELGQLLRAGLPLYESLLTIEEKYRNHKAQPILLDLCDSLKTGSSLSLALRKHPKSFDEVYLSMVHAAEQTASLPTVFDQLSLLISRQQKLKKQLLSALTYPAFLGSFCLAIVFCLLFFVIPSMQELFEGKNLHPLTEVVLGLSDFVKTSWHLILIPSLFLVFSIFYLLSKNKGRLVLQNLLLRVPFFKTIIIQSALIRFCRSLSILLAGGIPLIDALTLSRKVMKQFLLEKVIEEAEKKIVEGGKLSEQLKTSSLIPNLLIRMLAISEETGRVAPMLQNVAEIYDEELEKNLQQMTTFLQPALLLILGAIVGIVLLSILLPLTDVGSFASM